MMVKQLLSEREAATYLSMSRSFLAQSRCYERSDAPPYIRCGKRAIRYDIRDLDNWLLARKENVSGASTSKGQT